MPVCGLLMVVKVAVVGGQYLEVHFCNAMTIGVL